MILRSQSRENRSKVTVRADVHSESTGFATRPEPEVARPETEIAPVAGPSFGDIAAVSSRNPSVESGSDAGVEPQSSYPLPARQEPEITPFPFHPIANPPSFNIFIGVFYLFFCPRLNAVKVLSLLFDLI